MVTQILPSVFEYQTETVLEVAIRGASERFGGYMKNITFIKNVAELESLEVGRLVEVDMIGPMVFEGKINGKYAFMTRTAPGTDEISTDKIYSLRGEKPYMTRKGVGLLDFKKWSGQEIYSRFTESKLFAEKSKLLEVVGQ